MISVVFLFLLIVFAGVFWRVANANTKQKIRASLGKVAPVALVALVAILLLLAFALQSAFKII